MMKNLLPLSRQCEEVCIVITINNQAWGLLVQVPEKLEDTGYLVSANFAGVCQVGRRGESTHLADDVGTPSVAD